MTMDENKRYLLQYRTKGMVYGNLFYATKKEALEALKNFNELANVIDLKTDKLVARGTKV